MKSTHCDIMKFYSPFILVLLSIFLSGCHNNQQDDKNDGPTPQEINKELIPSQIKYIRQETDEINQYIKLHNYPMQNTGTGIRYMIYEHGTGPLVRPGQYVQITYIINLLDGTVCYDSKQDGAREFCVGKDDVESGVHQAVQLMHQGDKGLFIIPSYLAQGIAGDRDKIPPSAVVIYDISLLKVQDRQ